MLKNTFLKTLFEKRWTILIWTIALFIGNLLILQIFPPMKDAFQGLIENLPSSLSAWFGSDGQIWSSVKGYISLEITGQMAIVMVVFAITFSISILSGEESSGVILTQFSKPLSRRKYYVQKYLAFVAAATIVMLGFYLGTFIGTVILNDVISLQTLFLPMLAVWLLVITFGSLAFALSSATGSKVIGGALVGFYAVFGYFITSLRGAADILTFLSRLTPFYYYNNPVVMDNGLQLGNVLILLAIIIIPLIIALPIFTRRDLKTH